MSQNRYALIVAGGRGTRMNSSTPKQFMLLNGLPVLIHTLNKFHSLKPKPSIILVLPKNEHEAWNEICKKHEFLIPHQLVEGGKTRFHSVKNGLNSLSENGLVAIHDGVRPLASSDLIERCFAVAEKMGNAIPAINPHESVRVGSQTSNQGLNRDTCWLVQTPQVFKLKDIIKYYSSPWQPHFTDDASVAEHHNISIKIVDGERNNIKITTSQDIALASTILQHTPTH